MIFLNFLPICYPVLIIFFIHVSCLNKGENNIVVRARPSKPKEAHTILFYTNMIPHNSYIILAPVGLAVDSKGEGMGTTLTKADPQNK